MLGTGLMGSPIAVRLAQAGHDLVVWNRTRARTAEAEAAGARVAETAIAAIRDAEIVLVILENGPVVTDVLFGPEGAAAVLSPGSILVDMTSLPPEVARDHAARLADMGARHLDAPVSGGPGGAKEGSLAIMAGGTPEDFSRAQPVLSTFGRPTLVGPSGSGQLAKLCSQIVTGAALGAVAEIMLLAQAGGADPDRVRDALRGGFADSRVLQQHGRRMVERDFIPGGHVRTFIKDLDAAMQVAAGIGLDLPVATQVRRLLGAAQEAGYGECDIAAMVLETERRNPGHRAGSGADRLPAG
jgi:2-hydroxy-3-oxopropionate reductase